MNWVKHTKESFWVPVVLTRDVISEAHQETGKVLIEAWVGRGEGGRGWGTGERVGPNSRPAADRQASMTPLRSACWATTVSKDWYLGEFVSRKANVK